MSGPLFADGRAAPPPGRGTAVQTYYIAGRQQCDSCQYCVGIGLVLRQVKKHAEKKSEGRVRPAGGDARTCFAGTAGERRRNLSKPTTAAERNRTQSTYGLEPVCSRGPKAGGTMESPVVPADIRGLQFAFPICPSYGSVVLAGSATDILSVVFAEYLTGSMPVFTLCL